MELLLTREVPFFFSYHLPLPSKYSELLFFLSGSWYQFQEGTSFHFCSVCLGKKSGNSPHSCLACNLLRHITFRHPSTRHPWIEKSKTLDIELSAEQRLHPMFRCSGSHWCQRLEYNSGRFVHLHCAAWL